MKSLLTLILLISFKANAQISLTEFQIVTSIFKSEYDPEMAKRNARLHINRPPTPQMPNYWWDLDNVHASYSNYTDETGTDHYLFLFGGYARMEGMTVDGVAMTLCHEMGHGIGGAPYKDKGDSSKVSTEGQSDYYAARNCIKRIFRRLPPQVPVRAPDSYTASLCDERFTNDDERELCYRGFQVLEVERIFLRTQITDGTDTHFDTPDPDIASKINLAPDFYPAPQCRLDTMIAGILEDERPRCWWVPSK